MPVNQFLGVAIDSVAKSIEAQEKDLGNFYQNSFTFVCLFYGKATLDVSAVRRCFSRVNSNLRDRRN